MRYIYAIAACFTLFIFYTLIGSVLGWKSGGGAIPMGIFSIFLIFTWIAITKKNDRKWKLISQIEAEKNSLYGVKNWLAVFAFSIFLSPIYELATINTEAQKAGISLSQFFSLDVPVVNFLKLVIALEIFMSGIILWLLYSKHPKFRLVSSCILLSVWPVIALIGMANKFPEIGQVLTMSLFPWIAYCVLWITYLQRSKRVRVTFEHCILSAREGDINKNDYVDDDFYKAAYEETSSGQIEPVAWAKAFANSEGNQDKAKALYIKNRVEQLTKLAAGKHQDNPVEINLYQSEIGALSHKKQIKSNAIVAIVVLVVIGLLIYQLNKPSIKTPSPSDSKFSEENNKKILEPESFELSEQQYYEESQKFLNDKDWNQLEIHCLKWIDKYPNSPNIFNAWNLLGIAYFNNIRYDESINAYQKALGFLPNNKVILDNLEKSKIYKENELLAQQAKKYFDNEEWFALEKYCLSWTNKYQDNPLAWNYLGIAYYNNKKLEKSLKAYKKALEYVPGNQGVIENMELVNYAIQNQKHTGPIASDKNKNNSSSTPSSKPCIYKQTMSNEEMQACGIYIRE